MEEEYLFYCFLDVDAERTVAYVYATDEAREMERGGGNS